MKNLIIVCITMNDAPHGVLFLQQPSMTCFLFLTKSFHNMPPFLYVDGAANAPTPWNWNEP